MLEKKLEVLEQICDLLDETSSNEVRLSFLSLSYNQLVFLKNAIEKQILSIPGAAEREYRKDVRY